MSTYCYFECLDHDPPLRAREEFTQHVGDRHWDRALRLITERPVELDDSYWTTAFIDEAARSDSYFTMNARRFLHEHPMCRIGVIDEYGADYQICPMTRHADD